MTYAEKNPGKIIQNIALRQDFDRGELLCREAARPGQWVLLAAVRHTEAGALHALGGRPGETKLGDHPRAIRVSEAPEPEDAVGNRDGHPPRNARRCGAGAAGSVVLPICLRCGDPRTLQADGDQPQRPRQGRGSGGGYAGAEIPHPGFPAPVLSRRKPRRQGLRQRHSCRTAIPALRKLRQRGRSKGGDRPRWFLRNSSPRNRENWRTAGKSRRFSIRKSAGSSAPDAPACGNSSSPSSTTAAITATAWRENRCCCRASWTARCWKRTASSCWTSKPIMSRKARWPRRQSATGSQVQTYAEALSRIYEMPVKAKYLYFFQLGRFVEV